MQKRGISVETARAIRAARGLEETKLQKRRVAAGMSQDELARKSGVALRAIRGYEQRQNALEKAKFETVCDLACAMGCQIEDIMENERVCKKYRRVK